MTFSKKPAILLLGSGCIGKTTIAKEVSKHFQNELISLESLLTFGEVKSKLESGLPIDNKELKQLLLNKMCSDASNFKGFVMDDMLKVIENDKDLDQVIQQILKEDLHIFIVNLKRDVHQHYQKRKSQKVNPSNMNVFTQDVIDRSILEKIRRDNGEDLEAEEEIQELDQVQATENEEDEEDEEGVKKVKYVPVDAFEHREIKQDSVPLENMEIFVTRLEDIPSQLELEANEISKLENKIQEWRQKILGQSGFVTWLDVVAQPSPLATFTNLLNTLDTFGYDKNININEVYTFDASDGIEVNTDDANLNKIRFFKMQENEPTRETSDFMDFDPVAYKNTGKLVRGSHRHTAIFKGKIYLFENEEHMSTFAINPLKYLKTKVNCVGLNWCINGSDTAKTTLLAKSVAKDYGYNYVSVEEYLTERFDSKQTPKQTLEEFEIQAIEDLLEGKSLSSEFYVDLLKSCIASSTEKSSSSSSSSGNGWVFDNFPITAQHLEKILSEEHKINKILDIQTETPKYSYVEEMMISSETNAIVEVLKKQTSNVHTNFQSKMIQINAEFSKKNIYISLTIQDNFNTDILQVKWALDPLIEVPVPLPSNEAILNPFGPLKNYCPVSLKDYQCLVPGKSEFVMRYKNMNFWLASEQEKARFSAEPDVYIKEIPVLLPPKIAICGIDGCGKSTQAIRLAQNYGLVYLVWNNLVNENPDKQVQEIVEDIIKNEECKKKGFMLDGFPRTKEDVDKLKQMKFTFDIVVKFKFDPEELVKRRKKASLKNPALVLNNEESYLQKLMIQSSNLEESNPYFKEVSSFELDVNLPERILAKRVDEVFMAILENRQNLFIQAIEVPNALESHYRYGVSRLSRYGYDCPVEIKKQKLSRRDTKGTAPIIVQNVIYMVKESNKREFTEKTFAYLEKPALLPRIKSNIFVLGKDKKKTSIVAKYISHELDSILINPIQLLATLYEKPEEYVVGKKIRQALDNGMSVGEDIVLEAIQTITNTRNAIQYGWILDGFPYNMEQAKKLEALGIVPNTVLALNGDQISLLKVETHPFAIVQQINQLYSNTGNGNNERSNSETNNGDKQQEPLRERLTGTTTRDIQEQQILEPRLEILWTNDFGKNIQIMKKLYQERDQWIEVEGDKSNWLAKTQAVETLRERMKLRQSYLERKLNQQATTVMNVGLHHSLWKNNLSRFQNYCPVTFVDDKQLVQAEISLSNVVEYKSNFFVFASKEYQKRFIEHPSKYANETFPTILPERIAHSQFKSMFPLELGLRGYCPVTYKDGHFNFQCILEGCQDYLVKYDQVVYSFASEKKLLSFMRTPWQYHQLSLPKKLPPKKLSIPVASLPVVGYLEQLVADKLTDALLKCGNIKPKFPFKSLEESAAVYIGLLLKANNPNLKPFLKEHYKLRLKEFESKCSDLTKLSTMSQQYLIHDTDDSKRIDDSTPGKNKNLPSIQGTTTSSTNSSLEQKKSLNILLDKILQQTQGHHQQIGGGFNSNNNDAYTVSGDQNDKIAKSRTGKLLPLGQDFSERYLFDKLFSKKMD